MTDALSTLLKSRKVWLAIADAFFSSLAIILTLFFRPDVVDKILMVIGIWQPVVIVVIASITVQNVEGIKAGASVAEAKEYAAQKP
jgi:hypothetical protein